MSGVIGLLYERLPELRRVHGLSQNDLADLTPGVSLDTIRKYELKARAGAIPDAEILEALAKALNMEPDAAFYEYPIAAARRTARPGVSQRKVKDRHTFLRSPSRHLTVEEAARQRDRPPQAPARASKSTKGSGQAA
jgi:transcriptional regulator with XRE-family HTH domain